MTSSSNFEFDLLPLHIQKKIIRNIENGKATALMRGTCKEAKNYIDSQHHLVKAINESADNQFKLWRHEAIATGLEHENENERTYLTHYKIIKPSFRVKQISLKIALGISIGILAAGLIALTILIGNIALPLLGLALLTIPIFAAVFTFGAIKINSKIDMRFSFYRFIPDETGKKDLVKLFVDEPFSSLYENKSLNKLVHKARKLGFIRPETSRFLKSLIFKVQTNSLSTIAAHKEWETWKWQHRVIQQLPYLSRYIRR